MKRIKNSFRLLAEYHSFLFLKTNEIKGFREFKFPSPCGVSFILIFLQLLLIFQKTSLFPSPCGVSFILILQ